MGDRDIGSKADLVGELANLSKSPSSSRGGVGVRGGRRMVGFSEAMAAFESYYERLCVIVERSLIFNRLQAQNRTALVRVCRRDEKWSNRMF